MEEEKSGACNCAVDVFKKSANTKTIKGRILSKEEEEVKPFFK